MKTKEETQKKIEKLQMMEQRLQSYMIRKQKYQSQTLELENALIESKDTKQVYKMVGQIMVKADKEKVLKELKDKKDIADKRIEEINKQEEKLRKEILPLQEEVMKSFKNEK